MSNIKRRIASFVASFAMLGTVTVPSIAEYVSNDTVAVAAEVEPGYEGGIYVKYNKEVYLLLNTTVYKCPNGKTEKIAVISDLGKSFLATKVVIKNKEHGVQEKWYWIKWYDGKKEYDGFVYESYVRLKLEDVNVKVMFNSQAKMYQSPNTNSKVINTQSIAYKVGTYKISKTAKDHNKVTWFYFKGLNGWVCSKDFLVLQSY